MSGSSMDGIKNYVYTTSPIDYKKYLNYAGLNIDLEPLFDVSSKDELVKRAFSIIEKETITPLQKDIRDSIFIKE